MIDFLSAAKHEEAELIRKLAIVRGVISGYADNVVVSKPAAFAAAPVEARAEVSKLGSYGQGIVKAAMAHLLTDVPTRTSDLVEALKSEGVTIRGENKRNALSALLARSPEMQVHGRAGWTIAAPRADNKFDENEAPVGSDAEGAPEAEEVDASPDDNRPSLRLAG